MMNTFSVIVDVIGLSAITLITIAFIGLTILYFNSQEKMTICGLNDDSIRKSIKLILYKNQNKYSTSLEAITYFEKKKKRNAALSTTIWSICSVVCIVIILFTFFANFLTGSRHIWIGDTAMMTIKTESMATANEVNDYLFDENNEANENDRILQYSFITISKTPDFIEEIKPGDIVAFTMKAQNGKNDVTVVHRLINVELNSEGEKLYTFRGDANPSSMVGEYQIEKDKIVGVFQTDSYKGIKNVLLGYFVTYLQSSIGIAIIILSCIFIFVYFIVSDKAYNLYEKRQDCLLKEEAKMLFNDCENDINDCSSTHNTH